MDKFNIRITNFGKLTNALVRIGKFTVFAGRNNTGKSFVSKALYSIFGAMGVNHLAVVFRPPLITLMKNITVLKEDNEFQSESLTRFAKAVEKLRSLVDNIPIGGGRDELALVGDVSPEISQFVSEVVDSYAQLRPAIQAFESIQSPGVRDSGYSEEEMEEQVQILLSLKDLGSDGYVVRGIEKKITENFLGNFQVSALPRLCKGDGAFVHFDIEGVGSLQLKDDSIGMRIMRNGLRTMQQYTGVFYLESPVFWRLKNALESSGWLSLFRQVPDAPKYFNDMVEAMKREYTGGIGLSDVSENIADEIGGRVVADAATNNLFFEEKDGGKHPLHLAAMGVANFGMLSLVIEKNMLDENTFLFIDEPEAHLHPAWQLAMAKALIRLAEKGVNVVMATHSADILKWLETYVKENPEAEGLFALNHFADGTVKSGGDFREELAVILNDLTKPYQHMFIRGLRS